MKKINIIFIAVILICTSYFIFKEYQLYSQYSSSPQIIIINNSKLELKNIILSGSGFTEKAGNLVPGSNLSLVVHPRGESSLELSFSAKSEKYQKDDLAYIEASGGYIIKLIIDESLNIKLDYVSIL